VPKILRNPRAQLTSENLLGQSKFKGFIGVFLHLVVLRLLRIINVFIIKTMVFFFIFLKDCIKFLQLVRASASPLLPSCDLIMEY